jgi:Cu+-exporting ATPase
MYAVRKGLTQMTALPKFNTSAATPLSAEFGIEGMTCASCVRRVEKAISAVPGVTSAAVNLATERVTISLADPTAAGAVLKAIEAAGYEPRIQTHELAIEGMTCASCVSRVEKTLKAVPGVVDATVNLATEKATVRFAGDSVEALETAVRQAGYGVSKTQAPWAATNVEDRKLRELQSLKRALTMSAVLTLPLFLLEMGSHVIAPLDHWIMSNIGMENARIVQFVLASLVLFGPGLRFFRKGVSLTSCAGHRT